MSSQPKERQITAYEALRSFGWIVPADFVFLGALVLTGITLVFWKIFGNPSALNVIAVILTAIFCILMWIVVLIYRCSYFVLLARSDINLLPEASARLAVSYLSGNKQQSTPK